MIPRATPHLQEMPSRDRASEKLERKSYICDGSLLLPFLRIRHNRSRLLCVSRTNGTPKFIIRDTNRRTGDGSRNLVFCGRILRCFPIPYPRFDYDSVHPQYFGPSPLWRRGSHRVILSMPQDKRMSTSIELRTQLTSRLSEHVISSSSNMLQYCCTRELHPDMRPFLPRGLAN